MRQLSFVRGGVELRMGDGGDYEYLWTVGWDMKATDLVVCLSLIGVTAEPAHDFNICVMSEDEKGRKKDTG